MKCFAFLILPQTFLILRRLERDMNNNLQGSSYKVLRYSWQILMKLEFSRQIFEKYPNFKFNKTLPSGSQVVPYRRTYITKLIVAFRNFGNAPKKYEIVQPPTTCRYSSQNGDRSNSDTLTDTRRQRQQ